MVDERAARESKEDECGVSRAFPECCSGVQQCRRKCQEIQRTESEEHIGVVPAQSDEESCWKILQQRVWKYFGLDGSLGVTARDELSVVEAREREPCTLDEVVAVTGLEVASRPGIERNDQQQRQ